MTSHVVCLYLLTALTRTYPSQSKNTVQQHHHNFTVLVTSLQRPAVACMHHSSSCILYALQYIVGFWTKYLFINRKTSVSTLPVYISLILFYKVLYELLVQNLPTATFSLLRRAYVCFLVQGARCATGIHELLQNMTQTDEETARNQKMTITAKENNRHVS